VRNGNDGSLDSDPSVDMGGVGMSGREIVEEHELSMGVNSVKAEARL
jgi:hypothetical protein